MRTAMKGVAPCRYVPLDQREDDKPFALMLRPLTGEQLDHVLEGAVNNGDRLQLTPKGIKAALNFGIVSWDNFENDDGAVECKPANYGKLYWSDRQEIAGEIVNMSALSEDDKKN